MKKIEERYVYYLLIHEYYDKNASLLGVNVHLFRFKSYFYDLDTRGKNIHTTSREVL